MKKLFSLTFATLLLISCSNDDDPQPGPNPPEAYEKGILITNEGPFNNGSGTITFVSEDFATVAQNIYRTVNGKELGNIVQSMGFQDENAYIVVSNSAKIMIANRYSFESVDSIKTGLVNPRYFMGDAGNKGYVTDWGDPNDNSDDYVAVLDLRTNAIAATIPVAFGPERMVSYNNKIYVAHQGGYGQNNLISVISGNTVESTITVSDVPNSMVVSGNSLFVLCGGNPSYTGNETAGSLVKIDLSSGQVSNTYSFGATEHPSNLTMDGTNLFYSLDGKVYKLNSSAIALPGTDIISGFFYVLQAKDGLLYATDAGDYASKGSLKIFDLSTNQQIQDFQTGIVPGGIYFNE
ncbi:YncE family protein [Aequorivita sp. CIP111184]|uniref:YncE family protein n=1 Tax=Aequorivita sp. CIP111184 TaxID=2211356 RepID=UPI000DBBE051|nr:DUF5074 domain-containing protein [Aequorivita sp. CIP111184]SRX55760.1 hypothetical protein AEQU1_02785 [Aequorivita sp. CIP111184]